MAKPPKQKPTASRTPRPPRPVTPAGELPLPGLPAAAFSLNATATSAQLQPITNLTDADLRNLERRTAPTGAPWIPPARMGKRDTVRTLSGLIAMYRAAAEDPSLLPEQFTSMKDCEARMRFPVDMIEYARSHGCIAAFDPSGSGRIKRTPLLDFFHPLFQKMFAGGAVTLNGIEGIEVLDAEHESAALNRQRRLDLEKEAALRDSVIHLLPQVEKLLWENGLGEFRSGLLQLLRTHRQQSKQDPTIADRILANDIPKLLANLEAALNGQPVEPNFSFADGEGV